MNCSSCGLQLPQGATHCPRCGTATPYFYSSTGTTPNAPTQISTPYAATQQAPSGGYGSQPYGIPPTQKATTPYEAAATQAPTGAAPTQYATSPYGSAPQARSGSPSYGATPQNPYSQNPYNAPPYAPPPTPVPPPAKRPGNRIGLIVGIVLLVLILIGGGVFLLLSHSGPSSPAVPPVNAAATANAEATASAIAASQNPYTHNGTLAFSDPLSDNSKGHSWSTDAPNCIFEGGAYHTIAPDANYNDYCLAGVSNYSNVAIEAQMQIVKGDEGGIAFRVTSTNPTNQFYFFIIGQDGSYSFILVTGNSGSDEKTLTSGSNPAINQGLNQTNLIAVVAQGNTFMLYVNHKFIVKVTDSTYSGGQIGFIAYPNSKPTEVAFSNLKVWTL
jgi:hypothetical protein